MLNHLEKHLQQLAPDGIALAFSGGTDSTLLLALLSRLHQKRPFPVAALTMHTILQNDSEIDEAAALASRFGIRQKIFTFNPFSLKEVRHNRPDRCYHCKKAIFAQFGNYAKEHGLKHLLDGTNADDLNVYRPGRKALQELGVISPLAELGITKAKIRKISAQLNLPTASKPAVPCLATRFPYNTLLDNETIRRVSAAEKILQSMFPQIKDIRLRVHGRLARIEVPGNQIAIFAAQAKSIAKSLKEYGFDFITLDLEGFRSGCFDGGLKQN